MGIEGIYLNTIKAIDDKLTANIILNGEKLKVLPLRLGRRQGWSTITTLVNIVLKVLAEGWDGEGCGRGFQDGEHMCTHG